MNNEQMIIEKMNKVERRDQKKRKANPVEYLKKSAEIGIIKWIFM